MSAPRRPLLRYKGGKFALRRWIIRQMPPHKVYVEPYCGAASILLAKPRAHAEVINDLSGEIVRLFRTLRDPEKTRLLQRALAFTPFARREFEVDRLINVSEIADDVEAARILMARSFMAFGSEGTMGGRHTGFRARSWSAHRSAPADWAALPGALGAITERLRGVVIENRPALDVLRQHDTPGTLFYVDPPYLHSLRGRIRGYSHEMTEADHIELAGVLRGLRGAVMLSGYPSPLYEELYHDWARATRGTFANGAHARVEVIWSRPAAAAPVSRPGEQEGGSDGAREAFAG